MPSSTNAALCEAASRALSTPAGFQEWLRVMATEAADAFDVVGQGASPTSCPLSTYLTDLTGVQWEVISCCAHPFAEPLEAGIELPGWAINFVIAVDDRYPSFTEITADDALVVLAEVCGDGAS